MEYENNVRYCIFNNKKPCKTDPTWHKFNKHLKQLVCTILAIFTKNGLDNWKTGIVRWLDGISKPELGKWMRKQICNCNTPGASFQIKTRGKFKWCKSQGADFISAPNNKVESRTSSVSTLDRSFWDMCFPFLTKSQLEAVCDDVFIIFADDQCCLWWNQEFVSLSQPWYWSGLPLGSETSKVVGFDEHDNTFFA